MLNETSLFKDDEKIRRFLLIAAESELPEAQYQYGPIRRDRKNDAQAQIESIHWLALAAAQNHALASLLLGHQLATGSGTAKNLVQACDHFCAALEMTDDPLVIAGFIHELVILPPDDTSSMKALLLARFADMLEHPEKNAEHVLASLLIEGTPHGE